LKHAELMGRTPSRTAEDRTPELELREREFQRQLADGRAIIEDRLLRFWNHRPQLRTVLVQPQVLGALLAPHVG